MRVKLACSVILSLSMHVVTTMPLLSQTLPLPPREADALSGSQVVAAIRSLPRDQREERLYQEIVSGNVPEFLRDLVPVAAQATVGSVQRTVTYYVAPDYLAVGSDEDYFLAPMTPLLAQRLADQLDCILPTRLMVNQIYAAAPCKLAPQPIPPSAEMTTVPVFALHDSIVGAQREENPAPLGTLVGGTKKDVVISNRIYQDLKPAVPHPVVIYGWHQLNGVPIQPLYNGHGETYADYSHGIRLVQEEILLDGAPGSLSALLQDAELWRLLSDEGPIAIPRYSIPTSTDDDGSGGIPDESLLLPNYPNPFNPSTTIRLHLESASHVRLLVVGLAGEIVSVLAEGVLSPGLHQYAWNAAGRPSGVYFCRMESVTTVGQNSTTRTRRMLLLR
jgi:hypothetical protein